ncbi:MAG: alpha/beta hydrolase [Gammaproteobacteria bacterium]|nr:alpha/beta hydrolase [Gammaproteobacteria bacterium]
MNGLRGLWVAGPLLGLCVAVWAQEGTPRYPPTLPDASVHVYKTVGETALRLWVFEPHGHEASDRRPAAVFFFGGGWRTGSPAQFERQAKALRDRGMVGIVADYRVSSRHGTRPWHAVADAHDALRWVASHATELGIDPERMAAAGGSAGGHLAAATASLADPEGQDRAPVRPNALVLFNPAVVMADVEGVFDAPEQLVERFERRLEAMSPYHHLAAGHPPTLVLHGIADALVPADTAVAYCDRIASLGGDCEIVLYGGAPHGFFNRAPHFERTLLQMTRFLERLGWL